jgi:hypothetical protein
VRRILGSSKSAGNAKQRLTIAWNGHRAGDALTLGSPALFPWPSADSHRNRREEDVIISSGMTRFYKYVFPIIWFGFLATFFIVGWFAGARQEAPLFLVIPFVMGLFGYFIFRKVLWVLMDEVEDCGTYLIVRNGKEEDNIALSNIMNVSATMAMNPPQIALRLVQPCRFGSEVVFSPLRGSFTLNPFRKNVIAEDLIVRVDKARSSRARIG